MGTVHRAAVDAAAAAAVLDAMVTALREYEVGPHAAVRLVRALRAVDPSLVTDLIAGLDNEDDRFSEVAPEDLAEILAGLVTSLRTLLADKAATG
ncbi:hypothetical protein [Actinoplanes aureus]|uniref:Uncharacterized protein n=1 Tax=Actinoplanes aureus TaxID=2792083 RepID=A0A931G2W5_9ACTN|nr:hypothetical protein [Actinoplanes aureus]MBG0568605.1 hypothetical protein [Actinoplanes aureus]